MLMTAPKSLTLSFAVLALALPLCAQATQPTASDWSRKSKKAAEDVVAKKIDDIRASAQRPPLRRVGPSTADTQLVCTAALTGAKVSDPRWSGIRTYVTSDPSTETETLNKITLGLPKKDYPRYSVVVLRNADSTPEHPSYTIGVARRPSALRSALLGFFGPLFFGDNPFKDVRDAIADRNGWKNYVDPACRKLPG